MLYTVRKKLMPIRECGNSIQEMFVHRLDLKFKTIGKCNYVYKYTY